MTNKTPDYGKINEYIEELGNLVQGMKNAPTKSEKELENMKNQRGLSNLANVTEGQTQEFANYLKSAMNGVQGEQRQIISGMINNLEENILIGLKQIDLKKISEEFSKNIISANKIVDRAMSELQGKKFQAPKIDLNKTYATNRSSNSTVQVLNMNKAKQRQSVQNVQETARYFKNSHSMMNSFDNVLDYEKYVTDVESAYKNAVSDLMLQEAHIKSNKTISSFRKEFAQMIKSMTPDAGYTQKDLDNLAKEVINVKGFGTDENFSKGMFGSSGNLQKNIFRGVSDQLYKVASGWIDTYANNLSDSIKAQVSVSPDSMSDKIFEHLSSRSDMFSDKFIEQKVKKARGNVKINASNEDIIANKFKSKFNDAFGRASNMGLVYELGEDNLVKFGIFNKKQTNEVYRKNSEGKTEIDWSKVANINLGMAKKSGGFSLNGMEATDMFKPIMDYSNGQIQMMTQSQVAWEAFLDSIAELNSGKGKLAESFNNGQYKNVTKFINRRIEDATKGGASNGMYREFRKDVLEEISSDYSLTGSPTQKKFLENMIGLENVFQGIRNYSGVKESMTAKDVEEMTSYTWASIQDYLNQSKGVSNSNHKQTLLQAKGYNFNSTVKSKLEELGEFIGYEFPNTGISSIKDTKFNAGKIGALDSGVVGPWLVETSGVYRGIKQGANNVRPLNKRSSKFSEAVVQSDSLRQDGLDYSLDENKVMGLAEISNEEIKASLQGYYDELLSNNNVKEIDKLYKRYIGQKGKTVDIKSQVEALKHRAMPSVRDGGLVVSDDILSDFESIDDRANKQISIEDIEKLRKNKKLNIGKHIDNLNENNPLFFNEDSSLESDISLSNGLTLKKGDILKSLSYRDGKYFLNYGKRMEANEFPKMVSGTGLRVTQGKAGQLTEEEFKRVLSDNGLSNYNIGGLVEYDSMDFRKNPSAMQRIWQGVFSNLKSGNGNFDALDDMGKIFTKEYDETGLLQRFLNYDEKSGAFTQKFNNKKELRQNLSDDEIRQLFTVGEDGVLYKLLDKVFSGDKTAIDSYLQHRVQADTLNKADESAYFTASGTVYGSGVEDSHAKMTRKHDQAIERNANLMGMIYKDDQNIQEDYLKTYQDYHGGATNKAKQKASELKSSINDAYKKTKKSVEIDAGSSSAELIGLESLDPYLNDMEYIDGKISADDYSRTLLGAAFKNGKAGKDTYLDLGETFQLESPEGGILNVDKIAIPSLPLSDSDFESNGYGDLYSNITNLGKSLRDYRGLQDKFSGESLSEAQQQALDDARNRLMSRISGTIASYDNAMNYKHGLVKEAERNGAKVSNSTAVKATAADFSELSKIDPTIDNSIVIGESQLKDMMSYTGNDIGDLKDNISKIVAIKKMMAKENDSLDKSQIDAIDKGAEDILSKINDTTNIKDLRNTQNSQIKELLSMTNLYNSNGTGIIGDYFRYPLTSDQPIQSARIRTVSDKQLGKGQFWASDALARMVNLDWDGDTSYIELPQMKAKDVERAYGIKQKEEAYNRNIVGTIGKQIRAEQEADAKSANGASRNEKAAESAKKIFSSDNDKVDFISSVMSKNDFGKIGAISNLAYGMRLGMENLYSGDSDKFMNAKLVSALFEPLEQDAISAKKSIEKIQSAQETGSIDDSIISEAEKLDNLNQQIGGIDRLVDTMRQFSAVDFTDAVQAKKDVGDIVDSLVDDGFIGTKNNRQAQIVQAQVEEAVRSSLGKDLNQETYKNKMQELGIWDSRMTNYQGKHYSEKGIDYEGENGELFDVSKGGLITPEAYKSAILFAGQKGGTGRFGKNIFGQGISNMYAIEGGSRKDGDQELAWITKRWNQGSTVENGKVISNQNLSDSAKQEILEQENILQKEVSDYKTTQGQVVINAGTAIVNSKSTVEGDSTQNSNQSDKSTSGDSKFVSNKTSKRNIIPGEMTAEFSKLQDSNHSYHQISMQGKDKVDIDISPEITSSKAASGAFGNDFSGMVRSGAKITTERGTYAHLRQEYLENLKNDLLSNNSMIETGSELESLIKNSINVDSLYQLAKDNELNGTEVYEAFQEQSKQWYQHQIKKNKFTDAEVENAANEAEVQSEAMAKAANQIPGRTVATEMSTVGNIGGVDVGNTADLIKYDPETNTLRILDYKSGAKHDGQAAFQTSIGAAELEDLYKNFITDKNEKGYLDRDAYVAKHGLNIGERNARGLYDTFVEMKQKEAEMGFNIEAGVISNQGKTNGFSVYQALNRITDEGLAKGISLALSGQSFTPDEINALNYMSRKGNAVYYTGNSDEGTDKRPLTNEEFRKQYLDVYEKQQSKMIKLQGDAEMDLIKSNDPTRSKDEREAYASAYQFQMKQLKNMEKMSLVETEINGKVQLFNQETGESIELSDEQLQQLNLRKELLSNQQQAIQAKNNTYQSQDKQGFLGTVFNEFKTSVAYLTKTSLIYGIIGQVRGAIGQMIQTIGQLDTAMTNLQIVSRASREDLREAFQGYNTMAQEMGVSTQSVLSAANDWLRAGYSIEEANILIKDSLRLSVLGMMDAADATTQLISVMKGWKLSAQDMGSFVDSVTALDAEFATSAGNITTAMSKANVSASMSGVDLDNYQAYIATILETSQLAPESVGTSIKSVMARYGNVKSGKFKNFDGSSESEDGTYEALNDVETTLNKVGIATRNSVNTFRDVDDVIEDIATNWNGYNNVTQNAITTALGGTRQRESLNVLFENWNRVGEAKDVIANSSGTAEEKYEQYTKSIDAAKNELSSSIDKYVTGNDLLVQVMTKVYNIATDLVKAILPIGAVATLVGVLNKAGSTGFGKSGATNPLDAISYTAKGIKNNVRGAFRKRAKTAQEPTELEAAKIRYDRYREQSKHVDNGGLENIKQSYGDLLVKSYDQSKTSGMKDIFGSIRKKYADSQDNISQMDYNAISGWMSTSANRNQLNLRDYYSNGKFNSGRFTNLINNVEDIKDSNPDLYNGIKETFYNGDKINQNRVDMLSSAMGDKTMTSYLGMMTNGNQDLTDRDFKKYQRYNKWNSDKARNIGNIATVGGEVVGAGIQMVVGKSTTEMLEGAGWSSRSASAANVAASLAPVIGSAFGPVGQIVGGAVSALIPLVSGIFDKMTVTEEEVKQIRSNINSKYDEVIQANSKVKDAKDKESQLKGLSSGVNQQTGENISLSDEDYTAYQEILNSIAESSSVISIVDDGKGNKVLKRNGALLDLSDGSTDLSDSEKQTAYETAVDAYKDIKPEEAANSITFEARKGTVANQMNPITSNLSDRDKAAIAYYYLGGGYSYHDKEWDELSWLERTAYESEVTSGGDHYNDEKYYNEDAFKEAVQISRKYRNQSPNESNSTKVIADTQQQKTLATAAAATANQSWQNLDEDAQRGILDSYSMIYQTMSDTDYTEVSKSKGLGGKKGQKTLQASVQNLTAWANGIGQEAMNYLETYSIDNLNDEDRQKYQTYLRQKIDVATANVTDETIKKQIEEGFYADAGYIKAENVNYAEKYGFDTITGSDGKTQWITNKQSKYQQVIDAGINLDDAGIGIDKIDEDQLKILLAHQKDAKTIRSLTDLYNFVAKYSIGETTKGSQSYSSLLALAEQSSGRKFSGTQDLFSYLKSDEGQEIRNTAMYQQLEESAIALGITYVDENGNQHADLKKYLDQLDLVGNVDLNFHTDESLSDVKSKFEAISQVLQDVSADGTLSLDGLITAVDQLGDKLFGVLDDPDRMKDVLEDLQGSKGTMVAASIKTAMDESSDLLDDYLDVEYDSNGNAIQFNNKDVWTTKTDNSQIDVSGFSGLSEDVAGVLKGFGNIKTALEFSQTTMKHAESSDYYNGVINNAEFGSTYNNKYSMERDIAEQAGIDLEAEGASEKLADYMKIALEKAGQKVAADASYGDILTAYSQKFVANEQAMLEAKLMSLNNELAALEAAKKAMTEDYWKNQMEKVQQMVQAAYGNGTMSAGSYIASLNNVKSMMEKAGLTSQEMAAKVAELNEAIEDANMKLYEYKYSLNSSGYGNTARQYEQQLRNMAKNNTADSDDGQDIANKLVQIYQNRIDYQNTRLKALVSEDDYEGKRTIYQDMLPEYQNKVGMLIATGKSTDSPEVLEEFANYMDIIKAKNQTYIDEFSNIEQRWSNGNISGDDYIKAGDSLIKMASSIDMTREQFDELNEKMEDFYINKYQTQVDTGEKSYEQYRIDMTRDVLTRNQRDSADFQEILSKILSSYDDQINIISNKQKLSKQEYDYKSELDSAQKKVDLYIDKAANLISLGYSMDSKIVVEAMASAADAMEEARQVISQQMSDYNDLYSKGYLSRNDYVGLLKELAETENLSLEQMIDIREQMEQMAQKYYERNLSSGNYDSIEELILNYTADVTAKNKVGSESWYEGIDKISSFLNEENNKLQKQQKFIDPTNLGAMLDGYNEIIEASSGIIYALKNIPVYDEVTGKTRPLETDIGDNVLAAKDALLSAIQAQTEAIQKYGQTYEEYYSNGFIGWSEYDKRVQDLIDQVSKDVDANIATHEEVQAVKDVIQKQNANKFANYLGYGDITGQKNGDINSKDSKALLEELIYDEVYSSQAGSDQLEAWKTSQQRLDEILGYNSKMRSLFDEDDYESRSKSIDSDIELITNQLAHSINLFGEDSSNTLEIQSKAMSLFEEQNRIVSDRIQNIQNDSEQGFKSINQARQDMKEIADDNTLRGDARKTAYLQSKQMDADYYINYAKYDGMSVEDRMQGYLENVLTRNQYGSASYYKDLESYISMGQEAVNAAKLDFQLTRKDDYGNQREKLIEAIDALSEQYVVVSALEGEDSEAAKQLMVDIKNTYEEIGSLISQQFQQQSNYYQNGYVSAQKYEKYLKDLQASEDITVDQLIEANEALEQLNTTMTQRIIQSGDYDDIWKVITDYAENVVSKNATGSEAYYQGIDQITGFLQQDMQKKRSQIDFINPENVKDIISGLEGNAESSSALIYTLTNLNWKDAEGKTHPVATMDSDQVIELEKSMLESYQAISQAIDTAGQKYASNYENGYSTIGEYKNNIKDLVSLVGERVDNGKATLEEVTAVKTQVKNWYSSQSDYQLSYGGNLSFDEFYKQSLGSYLIDIVNNSAKGAEQINAWEQAKSIFGSYKQYADQKSSLLDPSDYNGRMDIIKEQIDNQTTMLAWSIKLFGENSKQAIEAENDVMNLFSAQNQVVSDALSDIRLDSEQGYISYKNKLNRVQDIYTDKEDLSDVSQRVLEQEIKNIYSDYYQNWAFREGQNISDIINGYLENVVSKNVYDSEGFWDSLEGLQNIISKEIQGIKTDINLKEDSDYSGRYESYDQMIKQQADSYSIIASIWGEDSEEAKQALLEMKNTYEEKMQIVSNQLQDYNDKFSNGEISRENLISKIEDLISIQDLTTEQIQKLKEALENAKYELLKYQKSAGIIYEDEYRKSILQEFIQKNETGSEPWIKYTEDFLNSFDDQIESLEQRRSLLGNDNVQGNIDNLKSQKDLIDERLSYMQAIARIQSDTNEQAEQALKASKEYNSYLEKRLDLEKQILQTSIDYASSVMDDYNTLSEYAISLFEDQKDIVNEYYDDQIKRLEEINDQRKDGIELLKLEQKLQSAKQEKVRVYQAGVGFTYLTDQQKVSDIEDEIEDYTNTRYIESLKKGQESANKRLDDLIENWRDIQNLVGKVDKNVEAQLAVYDLIQKGIIDNSDKSIAGALSSIMDKVIVKNQEQDNLINGLSNIGSSISNGLKIVSLGDVFDDLANNYKKDKIKLDDLTDNTYNVSDIKTKESIDSLVEELQGKSNISVGVDVTPLTLVSDAVNSAIDSIGNETSGLISKIINNTNSLDNSQTVNEDLIDAIVDAKDKIQELDNGADNLFNGSFNVDADDLVTAQETLSRAIDNMSSVNNQLASNIDSLTKILAQSDYVNIPSTVPSDPYTLAEKSIIDMKNAIGDEKKGLISNILNSSSSLGTLTSNADALTQATGDAKGLLNSLNTNLNTIFGSAGKNNIYTNSKNLVTSVDLLNQRLDPTGGEDSFVQKLTELLKYSGGGAGSSGSITADNVQSAIWKVFTGGNNVYDAGLFGTYHPGGFYSENSGKGIGTLQDSVMEAISRMSGNLLGTIYSNGGSAWVTNNDLTFGFKANQLRLAEFLAGSRTPKVNFYGGGNSSITGTGSTLGAWLDKIDDRILATKDAIWAVKKAIDNLQIQESGEVAAPTSRYTDSGNRTYGTTGMKGDGQGNAYYYLPAFSGWVKSGPDVYYEGNGKVRQLGSTQIYSFSEGIEKGPMTETATAMLHGSNANPEYVLNNKQAYKLLKNMATTNINAYNQGLSESRDESSGDIVSAIDLSDTCKAMLSENKSDIISYNGIPISDIDNRTMIQTLNSDIWNLKGMLEQQPQDSGSTYQFYGDMNLPNVNDAETFVEDLLKTAKNQFNITNQRYR